MDDRQRLQLHNMIKANDVVDQTELIRELKHSYILKNDISNLMLLKAKYRNDPERFIDESIKECNFLFTYYTDIYNKLKKDEIDINILLKFIDVLRQIEDGAVDQHEGSFLVGTLLKELYIDSALKKADKLNEKYDNETPKIEKEKPIDITWKQYKNSNL